MEPEYIGVRASSSTTRGNMGQVWTLGKDGNYHYDMRTLSPEMILSDVRNGFLRPNTTRRLSDLEEKLFSFRERLKHLSFTFDGVILMEDWEAKNVIKEFDKHFGITENQD